MLLPPPQLGVYNNKLYLGWWKSHMLANPDVGERVLRGGAAVARERATAVRDRALAACGLR